MPGRRNTDPTNDELYETLRDEGESEERSARIAGSAANRSRTQVREDGDVSPPFDQWTVEELRERAGEVGLEIRDSMGKPELIDALREQHDGK
jgi:hypothetical protein